jgi:hypothetical protein
MGAFLASVLATAAAFNVIAPPPEPHTVHCRIPLNAHRTQVEIFANAMSSHPILSEITPVLSEADIGA